LLELFYSETEKPKLKFLKQSSLKQALTRRSKDPPGSKRRHFFTFF
jgi:hypothetical protein